MGDAEMLAGDILSVDGPTLAAILAMAAATFAARAGGFAIVRRLRPTPFLSRWLEAVPGAMFVALVAPAVTSGGPPAWAGAVVTAVAARAGAPLLVALVAGAGTVALARALGVAG